MTFLQFLKDPDITIPYVLLLGKIIPEKWGKRHWGRLPYHLQHRYFYFGKSTHSVCNKMQLIILSFNGFSWTAPPSPYLLSC